jgi:hypothetical protein
MMSDNTRIHENKVVKIVERNPEPNGGGYYGYRCQWQSGQGGDIKERWATTKEADLRVDQKYTVDLEVRDSGIKGKNGYNKYYYSLLNIRGADAQPSQSKQPAQRATSTPDQITKDLETLASLKGVLEAFPKGLEVSVTLGAATVKRKASWVEDKKPSRPQAEVNDLPVDEDGVPLF